MLKKRLEGSHGKWAEELHGVLWAYRTTPKTATQKMHVRTTVSGCTSQEENDEVMTLRLDLLDEKREAARLRNWSYQKDVARTYNQKVRTRTIEQGDWVLRRVEKATGKLSPGWKIPY